MAFEAIRSYIQLAAGLTELSRAKATEAASAVLALPATVTTGTLPNQVQALAEELLAAASANRASLVALIRAEVESGLARSGLVSSAEVDRARAAIARLSADVEELRGQVLGSPAVRRMTGSGAAALSTLTGRPGATGAAGTGSSTELAPAAVPTTRTSRQGAAAQRSDGPATTKKAAAKSGTTKKAAAKSATTKKAAAKSATTKKAAAKSATTKKAATKRTTPAKGTATRQSTPTKRTATRQRTPAKRTATNQATEPRAAAQPAQEGGGEGA